MPCRRPSCSHHPVATASLDSQTHRLVFETRPVESSSRLSGAARLLASCSLTGRPVRPHGDRSPHSFLSPQTHSAFKDCGLHREACFHQPRESGPHSARRAPRQTGQEVRRRPWSPRHVAMVTSQEQGMASTEEGSSASLTQAPPLLGSPPPPHPRCVWVSLTVTLGRSYFALPLWNT